MLGVAFCFNVYKNDLCKIWGKFILIYTRNAACQILPFGQKVPFLVLLELPFLDNIT